MWQKARIISLPIIGLLFLLSIPSVSTAAPKQKLTILARDNGAGYEPEVWKQTVRLFKEKYPDMNVNIVYGGNPATDKFLAMMAGGSPPDVVQLVSDVHISMAAKGLLKPLDPFMARDRMQKGMFMNAYVDMLTYKGQMYCFDPCPGGTPREGEGINTDMFDMAGIAYPDGTWKWEVEGLQAGRKITRDIDGDGKADQYFYANTNLATTHRAFWIWNSGGDLLEEKDGKWTFAAAKESSLRGMQFAMDLFHKYRIAPTDDDTKRALNGVWAETGFFTLPNKVAMIETNRQVWKSNKSKNAFTVAPLLTYNGNRTIGARIRNPWGMAEGARNVDAAWKWMKFIVSDEAEKIVARVGGYGVPGIKSKSVWDVYDNGLDPADKKAYALWADKGWLSDTRPWPTHPAWPEVLKLYAEAVNISINKGTPVVQTFKQIEARANSALARFKARR